MPQHIVSIEVPNVKADEEAEEEDVAESEEEYESDDEDAQEQLFCNAQFITQEAAQQIEEDLKEGNFFENECYYQYEETERGKFHTGNLNEEQQQTFIKFVKLYQNLFTWDSNNFGRMPTITHVIDTGDALSIKQKFYRTSYKSQLFINDKIQRLLESSLIIPSISQ